MRNIRTGLLSFLAGIGAFALSNEASAQVTVRGYAVDRYTPSESGSEWLATDSLDIYGQFRPSAKLTFDYGLRPRVVTYENTGERVFVIRHRLNANVNAAMVFFDRLRLGIGFPVTLWQSGESGNLLGYQFNAPSGGAAGDLRLALDGRIVGDSKGAFRLGVGAQVFLPTGNVDKYASDGKVRVAGRIGVAGDVGDFAYAANLGGTYRAIDLSNEWLAPEGSEFNLGASVGYRLIGGKLLVGPELFLATSAKDMFSKDKTPTELLVSAHYQVTDDWRVHAGGGAGIVPKYGATTARAVLGVEWAPALKKAPTDRDNDGITDDKDACPDVAGVADPDPKRNGCPVPDRDGDGIPDDKDACPDVKGVSDPDPKKNGCPLPGDKDGDGITDDKDACPDVKGVASDDPKKNGCPLPDRDGDGVLDDVDACPDKPGVKSDNAKWNGCPVDLDGDGIPNDKDACPTEAGKADPDPKKNGCPKAFVSGGRIQIIDQVKFATGSAAIVAGKESQDVLEAVLKILKDRTDITAVRVEGHTDNVGSPVGNKALSQMRAQSVVAWFVKNGLDKKRFTAVGYGQEKPIADNKTEAGRHANRRVEFHIVAEKK